MQYFFFPLCIFSALRQGLPPAPGRKNSQAGFHFPVISSPGKWKAAGKTGPSFSSRLPLGAGVPGLQPALLWGARLPSDHSPRASLRGVPRKAPPFYSESRPIPGRGPGGTTADRQAGRHLPPGPFLLRWQNGTPGGGSGFASACRGGGGFLCFGSRPKAS